MDSVDDETLRKKVEGVGKDITLKVLVELTGLNAHEVFDLDINFVRRTLYAHHAAKAYELKRAQMRAAANKTR